MAIFYLAEYKIFTQKYSLSDTILFKGLLAARGKLHIKNRLETNVHYRNANKKIKNKNTGHAIFSKWTSAMSMQT